MAQPRTATLARLNSAYSESTDLNDEATNGADEPDNIRVVIRVRPINQQEMGYNYREVVQCVGDGLSVQVNSGGPKSQAYRFSGCIEPTASQRDVFEQCGVTKLLDSALEGYQTTIFAFGQTGSGKTHTISGEEGRPDGLMPRAIHYLYETVKGLQSDQVSYHFEASYCEIYNEQVKDLLNPTSGNLAVRWSEDKGFYVENLFIVFCDAIEDMMAVLEEGLSNRRRRAHEINDLSSRSHALLSIYVRIEEISETTGRKKIRFGKTTFVDLAGSERVKESGATGAGLTEARNINKSLLTLGNCISALGSSKGKNGHIPFRDSTITKLLKDSLGGSGITLMMACLAPHDLEESVKTLRYAARAKRIRNKPVVNMDPKDMMIAALQQEVKRLEKENAFLRGQASGETLGRLPASGESLDGEGGGGKGLRQVARQDGTPSSSSKSKAAPVARNGSLPIISEGNMSSPATSTRKPPSASGAGGGGGPAGGATPAAVRQQLREAEDVINAYMKENSNLKAENNELLSWRMNMGREHANALAENDSLRKRLDALEQVFMKQSPQVQIPRAIDRQSGPRSAKRATSGDPRSNSYAALAYRPPSEATSTASTARSGRGSSRPTSGVITEEQLTQAMENGSRTPLYAGSGASSYQASPRESALPRRKNLPTGSYASPAAAAAPPPQAENIDAALAANAELRSRMRRLSAGGN